MYVGTQLGAGDMERLGDRYLRQLSQLGVKHVAIDPPGSPYTWTRDHLARHIDRHQGHGLILDMVQLPMPSAGIRQHQSPGIVLGQSPERDREIDGICRIIEDLSAMGIGTAKYNFNLLGIPRTPTETGRGGARVPSFRHEQLTDFDTPTAAGQVSTDQFWDRITYFLERVVPVAESNRLRLACHPHDPLTPKGYRGVEERVLGHVEGLKRFVSIAESPYHGLNFCQGTIAESLDDPDAEIDDIIRWFGERKKIFNVHFRNIRGHRFSFTEVFPDDGDMDMARTFGVYRDVGVDCMIMPDHMPAIDGEAPFETAFAFAFGYIIALFQASGLDPYGP